MDLRCEFGILFARIVEVEGLQLLEFKCRSTRCGAEPGVVQLHRFTFEGKLHSSPRFKDPAFRKEVNHGDHPRSAALRSA